MIAPVLRAYQHQCVAALRCSYASGRRAPLFVLPTGGGKTVVFAEITRSARAKGRRTLIVVHRRELLKQAAGKLTWAGVPHGIVAGGFDATPDELVQVGSIQTLDRRLEALPQFDLIVLDECHHCRASTWRRLLTAQPSAKLLGVTATPARLDGKGLGIQAGGPFDDLVIGPGIAELVAGGFLSPTKSFVPERQLDLSGVKVRAGDYVSDELASLVDKAAIVRDAVEQYRLRADHQPAIAFCCTVAHAEHVAEAFRGAGYRSQCVHGGTAAAERDALIAGLGTGAIEVLTSCDLVSESLVLHMQQIGRAMRSAPGKGALIVNDHVGNVLEHGLPDAEREWSLAGVPKVQRQKGSGSQAPVWRCECGCLNPTAVFVCLACDQERPGRRQVESVPGNLAELTADRLDRARRLTYPQMMRARLSEAELREFARARGYKQGWVFHRLREQVAQSAGAAA